MRINRLAIALGALVFTACGNSLDANDDGTGTSDDSCTRAIAGPCVDLIAGQHEVAGKVCLEVVAPDLLVTYYATGGWELLETQLWVSGWTGPQAVMPQVKNGNPVPGKFPYRSGHLHAGSTSWTARVRLGAVIDTNHCGQWTLASAAAHASMRHLSGRKWQEEGAWAAGKPLPGPNWATWFDFNIGCDGVAICGDGEMDGIEGCDDGGTADGDGCSSRCEVESGWSCTGAPSVCARAGACGNGTVAGAEECDDGNLAAGDGCSPTCTLEPGWQCSPGGGECTGVVPVCGDGLVVGGETCDVGDPAGGPGCSGCQVESFWICIGEPSVCVDGSVCGDGVASGSEDCDFGEDQPGDACAPDCRLEPGWYCDSPSDPSSCRQF